MAWNIGRETGGAAQGREWQQGDMVQQGTLIVEDLHMTYPTADSPVRAVQGVSFTVQSGEFYTLLGASGCGKTTILRCVAGLEAPERGRIVVGDTVVYSSAERIAEPPNRRDIGMVFQSYAIWPHLSVFANVAFPLVSGRHRFPRQEVHEKTMRALRLVQLDSLADRPAPFLSGGQQQRVALARALVAEPTVLLLDEPLSNLDAKLRAEMRFELKHLVKSLGVTTLYVTHDQMEALTMSDKVAVMQGGTFVEEATPKDLYLRPRSAFTATFLGDTNLIAGTVTGGAAGDGLWQVETLYGPIICPIDCGPAGQDSVWVACRPEGVVVTAVRPPGENVFPGRITTVVFAGDQIIYSIAVGEQTIQVKSDPFRSFQDGDQVFVQLPPERCLLIRRDEA